MSSLYPEQQLRRRAMSWAIKVRVNPEQVLFARLSDKWGSCAPNGIVTFAEDLAEKDPDFQDFVIVHELLHLRYKTHGKRFQAMMSALVPRWRELERQSRHMTQRRD
jgi:predicted metal-dependent hydrolase